jgi:hypothetical protein
MAREAAGRNPPTERTSLARAVLLPAIALGVLADVVVRAHPPGFGLLLWTASLVGAGAGLVWWRRDTFRGVAWWLPLAALVAASGLAWRDSPALKALDLFALTIVFALTAVRSPGLRLRLLWLTDLALAAVTTGLNALLQPIALASDLARAGGDARARWFRHAMATAIGIGLALPLVLLFGVLFVAADAVFAGTRRTSFASTSAPGPPPEVTCATWLVAGFLWGAALDERLVRGRWRCPARCGWASSRPASRCSCSICSSLRS